MNTELIITLIKFINVIFCLAIIAICLWQNSHRKLHSTAIIALILILFFTLLWQIINTTHYELISTSLLFIIVIYLLVKNYKAKKPNSLNSDDLINQAREQERSRIYANLHDDVGAKLLELIYTAKDEESKSLAKQALSDIRQAVASTINVQCSVNQLATEIIEEASIRLSAASIALIQNTQISNPKHKLIPTVPIVISRICREVISNTIKHAEASQVELKITSTERNLIICIQDNGIGLSEKNKSGKGLKTINKRAQSIHSVVEWQSNSKKQTDKGTKFTLTYQNGNH